MGMQCYVGMQTLRCISNPNGRGLANYIRLLERHNSEAPVRAQEIGCVSSCASSFTGSKERIDPVKIVEISKADIAVQSTLQVEYLARSVSRIQSTPHDINLDIDIVAHMCA